MHLRVAYAHAYAHARPSVHRRPSLLSFLLALTDAHAHKHMHAHTTLLASNCDSL